MPRPNEPGWLVVLEGIDGAGKTTVTRLLADFCAAKALDVVVAHEPTKGQWGTKLRESMAVGRLSLEEELEIFLKDRAEHVAEVIGPALAAGKIVLLDRYYLSTVAYQGARGADPGEILQRNEAFAPTPDLALLLDVDPSIGLQRIYARGDSPNTFEQLDQLREVRRIFLSIDRPFIRRVDAAMPAADVGKACCDALDTMLSGG